MSNYDRELNLEAGLQNLYETLRVDSRSEIIQAEIRIYQTVEDAVQELGATDKYDNPESIEMLGNAIAAHYSNLAEILEEEDRLDEDFHDLSIEEQLDTIEEEFEDGQINSIV